MCAEAWRSVFAISARRWPGATPGHHVPDGTPLAGLRAKSARTWSHTVCRVTRRRRKDDERMKALLIAAVMGAGAVAVWRWRDSIQRYLGERRRGVIVAGSRAEG